MQKKPKLPLSPAQFTYYFLRSSLFLILTASLAVSACTVAYLVGIPFPIEVRYVGFLEYLPDFAESVFVGLIVTVGGCVLLEWVTGDHA